MAHRGIDEGSAILRFGGVGAHAGMAASGERLVVDVRNEHRSAACGETVGHDFADAVCASGNRDAITAEIDGQRRPRAVDHRGHPVMLGPDPSIDISAHSRCNGSPAANTGGE